MSVQSAALPSPLKLAQTSESTEAAVPLRDVSAFDFLDPSPSNTSGAAGLRHSRRELPNNIQPRDHTHATKTVAIVLAVVIPVAVLALVTAFAWIYWRRRQRPRVRRLSLDPEKLSEYERGSVVIISRETIAAAAASPALSPLRETHVNADEEGRYSHRFSYGTQTSHSIREMFGHLMTPNSFITMSVSMPETQMQEPERAHLRFPIGRSGLSPSPSVWTQATAGTLPSYASRARNEEWWMDGGMAAPAPVAVYNPGMGMYVIQGGP